MRQKLSAILLATTMLALPSTAHAQAMSAEEAAALRAELAALKAQVRHLSLEHAIRFMPAMPARKALALGRIMVIPSRAESLPYVVLETAAAGKPLITTNVGGIPEIFGLLSSALIPAGDTEALAGAIVRTLDHPDAAERLASEAGNARIVRIPGTTNRKGSGTADRPHRTAHMLTTTVPEIVPLELLRALAATIPQMAAEPDRTVRPATAGMKEYDPNAAPAGSIRVSIMAKDYPPFNPPVPPPPRGTNKVGAFNPHIRSLDGSPGKYYNPGPGAVENGRYTVEEGVAILENDREFLPEFRYMMGGMPTLYFKLVE